VTILLDENFPLGLVRILESDGLKVEHIITRGWRGAPDARIRARLSRSEMLFLTQDERLLVWRGSCCDRRRFPFDRRAAWRNGSAYGARLSWLW
jgi:Domain of unknown function (DUF5615)